MPQQLLGPNGQPISSGQAFVNKKAAPPKTGEAFGKWAGDNGMDYVQMPGGGIIQFDLSKLTVEDFRNMRDHYQVNASLSVLSFMQHQSDFHVECEDRKIEAFMDEQLHNNWTLLNRGMSQSNWAGYSPMVLDYENRGRRIELDKVRDLRPDDCVVKWDTIDGWAPPGHVKPKLKVYGGIKQDGYPYPVPVENSLWYPMIMENGDYYGRKLLRPAFTSYFFSILIHLFSNRYYERFGEPTPVGRAPFEDDLVVDNKSIKGNEYLLTMLRDLRNRSVVVLPNDKTQFGNEATPSFDYDIEYLESQMRGADFERYLTRLDEEISIGLFTPILLLRTADVGSYNLGQGHMQVYLWMLNAMNADRKQYLDKYILSKMTNFNFSTNAPRPKTVFRKLGSAGSEILKELLTALTQRGSIDFDYDELGQMAGMTVKQVRQTLGREDDDADDDAEDPDADAGSPDPAGSTPSTPNARAVAKEIRHRVARQVKDGLRPDIKISMGFKRRMADAYRADGVAAPGDATDALYARMDNWVGNVVKYADDFSDPQDFVTLFSKVLDQQITVHGMEN